MAAQSKRAGQARMKRMGPTKLIFHKGPVKSTATLHWTHNMILTFFVWAKTGTTQKMESLVLYSVLRSAMLQANISCSMLQGINPIGPT